MKNLRARIALLAALSLLLLGAGCGGDNQPAEREADVPEASDGVPSRLPLLEGEPCDVAVTLSGAVERQWSGEGVVDRPESGPVAVYQSAEGPTVLTVYAAGNGFDANVVVSAGEDSYGTSFGAAGLDVAADGSGATIDAEAIEPDSGGTVRVVATFSC